MEIKPIDYYDLQEKQAKKVIPAFVKLQKNQNDENKRAYQEAVGSFMQFDSSVYGGIENFEFKHYPKFDSIQKLFEKLDYEISCNRYVLISLRSNSGYHIWIIYSNESNDYQALTKVGEIIDGRFDGTRTCFKGIRSDIVHMNGTDLLCIDGATDSRPSTN
jgi:hypothetical protein